MQVAICQNTNLFKSIHLTPRLIKTQEEYQRKELGMPVNFLNTLDDSDWSSEVKATYLFKSQ